MQRRPIALTMGDPAGIGPEITAKAWTQIRQEVPLVFVGDPGCLQDLGIPVRAYAPGDPITDQALSVIPVPLAQSARPGIAAPENASATIKSIETAVALTQAGDTAAVVTNPITKRILVDGAGFAHPGHTEFLAALDGVASSVMMLACAELRVVPVTIHIPLMDVATTLTPALLTDVITITETALRTQFGIPAPRIAVAGLNPHAGEGGMMGGEELAFITPALDVLRAGGMDIRGPLPADTMFHAAARDAYDVAICMYHDQALIPIKTLGFDQGVNITLGLSFIRTSPDHGTAYDIAGRGLAKPDSLIAAIRMADEMSATKPWSPQ